MEFIDLTAFRCPVPMVRVKMALKGLATGMQLHVLLSDSGSRQDVPAFLKKHGFEVSQTETREGHLLLVIIRHEPQ
ncbi:MAG: sulfurtransferase TusA family protein [Shewanella sp.]|nr:sulfurtransferase TusA family protein [Shewanella sp.]MCF1432057.1 sulfurtransferase TusA family protein [Shewanella sp.]MCF1440045.1 sulfurtransferase TusA family protein [Shewanella sp.]MCF1456914.1 sulfurtransferase TusA family protein [Shewanella sp.]